MKKLLFLLIAGVAGTCTVANAQIQKGNVMVGADLMNMGVGFGSPTTFKVEVNPSAAWFIKDNFAIGAAVDLAYSTPGDNFAYAIGPIARYYLSPGEHGIDNLLKHGRWFLNAGAGIAGTNGASVGFNLHFGPGYEYFITPNIGLEGLVEYNGIYGTGSNNGLRFGLGFRIHMPSSRIKNAIKNPSQL